MTNITENKCRVCNAADHSGEQDLFDDLQTETFLRRIYDGFVNLRNLDYDLYIAQARRLAEAVYKGFGKDIIRTTYGTPDHAMLHSLRENVYVFSAAKTYQQTKEISQLLHTPNGIKPLADFMRDATPVFDRYNREWLTVEYNSAMMQARSASQWMDIERDQDIYDQLEYHTVGDARVRPEHQALNGTIRPVKDKFWDVYFPPNGWSCRCTVLQVTGEPKTDLRTLKISKEDVPDIFRFNPGKDKIVFSPAHPYFDVAKKDRDFAKTNFGLPLPMQGS